MTKGYHNYRGRGGRQKRLLAVVLVLVILAATAFLVIQNYIVYDDAGKAHIEWPFRKDEPQPDDNATPPVSQDDVNIDYVDNGYAPHLQELHAQMLPGNALRQAPETVLADLTEDAFAVEVKRVNGSIPYATQVDIPQEVEAERQQMLARLRTELWEQVCAIHADVILPPDREQGSEAAEQQLHILLYQTDVPEAELDAALSDLRAQRRREKAQYQGAPFADVFQVELILSEEDSDRACIVDVGDTGMRYVIP